MALTVVAHAEEQPRFPQAMMSNMGRSTIPFSNRRACEVAMGDEVFELRCSRPSELKCPVELHVNTGRYYSDSAVSVPRVWTGV